MPIKLAVAALIALAGSTLAAEGLSRSSDHAHRAIRGRRQLGCARAPARRAVVEIARPADRHRQPRRRRQPPRHRDRRQIRAGRLHAAARRHAAHHHSGDPEGRAIRSGPRLHADRSDRHRFDVLLRQSGGEGGDRARTSSRSRKPSPDKITIASGGIGSATHLTAELFQAKTGIKLVHVPFRGAGPAMNDLVAGHVQSGFTTLATASSVLDRVRALAIASETRLATRTEHSDLQGRRHRSGRRALVGRARSGRPAAADRRTPDGGPQGHSRLGRVRDAPRAARRHGVPCLAGAVPCLDRERHGALGRYRQVGRDQRPVTDAASAGRLFLATGQSPATRRCGRTSRRCAIWAAAWPARRAKPRRWRSRGSGSRPCRAQTFARMPVDYPGWRCRTAQLTEATTGAAFPCTPLLGTASAAGLVGGSARSRPGPT